MAATRDESGNHTYRSRMHPGARPSVTGRAETWRKYRQRVLMSGNGSLDLPPEPIEPRKRQRILDLKREWERRLEVLSQWAPDREPEKAKAAATLLRLLFDSGCSDSLLSLDELVGLTDAVQRSNQRIEKLARQRRKSGRVAGEPRSMDVALWQVVSMEHALLYLKASQTPEIAGMAAQIAAGRSRPGGAMIRALEMYRIFLTANLRGRGIDPDRVVQFRATRLRPMNPILPPNTRMGSISGVEWADPDGEEQTKPIIVERERQGASKQPPKAPKPKGDSSFLAAPPRIDATGAPPPVPGEAAPPSAGQT